MRDLLHSATEHFQKGKVLAEQGKLMDALSAYKQALRDLHALRPQHVRDVLLAKVYLSRYEIALQCNTDPVLAMSDLRMGYSYARTTKDPNVREVAEKLWQAYLKREPITKMESFV